MANNQQPELPLNDQMQARLDKMNALVEQGILVKVFIKNLMLKTLRIYMVPKPKKNWKKKKLKQP